MAQCKRTEARGFNKQTTRIEKQYLKKKKEKGFSFGQLYTDKLGAEASTDTRLLERIRTAANAYASRKNAIPSSSSPTIGTENAGTIERTFAALLDPKGFRARIYPGLKIPDGFDAPQSLQELLNDARFKDSLTSIMPDVVARADTVIKNVKEKAEKSGEIMDRATESALRPKVLLEAFARQITKVIGQTSARFMAQTLRSLAPRASENDERAEWDQLRWAYR